MHYYRHLVNRKFECQELPLVIHYKHDYFIDCDQLVVDLSKNFMNQNGSVIYCTEFVNINTKRHIFNSVNIGKNFFNMINFSENNNLDCVRGINPNNNLMIIIRCSYRNFLNQDNFNKKFMALYPIIHKSIVTNDNSNLIFFIEYNDNIKEDITQTSKNICKHASNMLYRMHSNIFIQ